MRRSLTVLIGICVGLFAGCGQAPGPQSSPAVTIMYVPVTTTPDTSAPQGSAGQTATSPPASSVPSAGGQAPTLGGCPIFPADSVWNTPIDTLPVHSLSDRYIDSIGRDTSLHPDFGSGLWEGEPIGIPYNVVPADTPEVAISFHYADESDAGPYRIPADPLIEGGPDSDGDRHILIVEQGTCRLVEIYDATPQGDGSWEAGAGAIWDLHSHALRPETWTSADAAGLPILAGLVRYDEAAAGAIHHALRFTAEDTQRLFVWPARHYASDITDASVPPMGARFRLKASFDISPYPPEAQAILRAMQRYGIILADNGSSWFITGAPDDRWDNEMLVDSFRTITGNDFEAVDTSSLMIDPDSGQARQP